MSTPPRATPQPTPGAETDELDLAKLLAEPAPIVWYRRRSVWCGALALVLLATGISYWLAQRSANGKPTYTRRPSRAAI